MVTCQEGNLGVPCQRRSSSAGPRSSDLASIHILILWHFIDATVALTTTMSGYTPFRHPSQVGYHLVPLVLPSTPDTDNYDREVPDLSSNKNTWALLGVLTSARGYCP